MNKCKKIKLFLIVLSIFFCESFTVSAQYSDKWISLKYESVRHKSHHFYFSKILDERRDRSKIGEVYGGNQLEKQLKLSGGTTKTLQNYLLKTFEKNTSEYPIVFKIKEFFIDENVDNSKIKGKCKIKVSYSFQRDTTEVELTDFQTAITYTRSLGDYNNYETLLSKVLDKSINYFAEWMDENYDKNSKLIKSINLVVKPDYLMDNPEKGDTIFWSPTRKMTWTDFKGEMPKNTKYSAQIFNNFEYLAPLKLEDGILTIALQMKVYMLKSASWTSSTSLSDYSIAHEQLHFDLTKLIVERFKERAKQILTVDNYDSELQLLFIEMYREMNHVQKEYDDDTNHSINTFSQQKWQSKTVGQMRNLGIR